MQYYKTLQMFHLASTLFHLHSCHVDLVVRGSFYFHSLIKYVNGMTLLSNVHKSPHLSATLEDREHYATQNQEI